MMELSDNNNNDNEDDNKMAIIISILNEVVFHHDDSSISDEEEKKREVQEKLENKMQKEEISAEILMSVLAPNLFSSSRADNNNSSLLLKLSSIDTIQILMMMVTSNRSKYLKPASRAVKSFVLNYASGNNNKTAPPLHVSDNLLHLIVSQLSDSLDAEISSNATETLVACCQMEEDALLVTRSLSAISEAFQSAWERKKQRKNFKDSSTCCVRCVATIVMLLCANNYVTTTDAAAAGLSNEKKKSLNDCLLPMLLDDSDPLLQMSAFDLAEQLPKNASAADDVVVDWLLSTSVLEPIFCMVGGSSSEQYEPHPILGGPALRLLSCICSSKILHKQQNNTEMMNIDDDDHYSWLRTRFHHVLRNAEVKTELDRLAHLDAVSSFAASSPEALEIVLDDDVIRLNWLSLSVAQPKLRSAILYSVAMVLNHQNQNNANNALCMRLFTMLGQINNNSSGSSMGLLISLARSSVTEVRLGAYTLLEALVCQHTFARLLFMSSNDLFEFLLNREGVERTIEGREARFNIVKAILSQQRLVSLMDPNLVKVLEEYVQQGPHYVTTQAWNVATC